jgi:hypothetical protein
LATFEDFFFGANFALWEEAIADIFQSIEDQREAALNAIYLSTALISELAQRYGVLVGSKPDPGWQLEVFREHLQEVIQAYLMMSGTRAGVQQVVAATTQVPPILRPINLLQRWLLGFQYLPNRFFVDLDGFVTAEIDGPYTIDEGNGHLILVINGVEQSFELPYGDAVTAKEVIDSINSTIVGALAFPFGKRFAIETIETDIGGSIKVKVESTADTLFGLDTTERDNAPVLNGTGVLPFGWRLTGSYIPPPPLTAEDDIPEGTDSHPISFDGALFGVLPVSIKGANTEPFVGLLSPIFLTNGGFEDGFEQWDTSEGPNFFISTTKSRTGSKSLAVITRAQNVIAQDGTHSYEPVVDTITTAKKFVPVECLVSVSGYHQAKTPGAVYSSPAGPPSVYEWLVSNGVFGYADQQFSQTPVVNNPDAPTLSITDTSVNFLTKGIKVGMAVHVDSGSNAFDGVIKGVSTHTLLIDQWRNGPNGGPTTAHISGDAAPGSGVTYTSTTLQDPANNFATLGVQVGADFRTRDKVRVNETISHFGQITTERQIVRDIVLLNTTTNPNDTIIPQSEWGASPTPESATISTSGNPYAVYIRPPNGTKYTIFHTLNEIPNFAANFAKVSASFEYELRFFGFDGRLVHADHFFFRPIPGDDYEPFQFSAIVPDGGETVQLAITVGPDDEIAEAVTVAFDTPIQLSQKNLIPGSEVLRTRANITSATLTQGDAPKHDYDIDYEAGTITIHSSGPAETGNATVPPLVFAGDELAISYQYRPKPGAAVSIDDIVFRCEEDTAQTELHVAIDGKMQKIVFADPMTKATGVITYTGIPIDGDGVQIGDEKYEFDLGSKDTGTINYTGQPNDGDTVTIGDNTYEFDNNCVLAPGNIQVIIDGSADLTFTNLNTMINHAGTVVSSVIDTGANTVTVTAHNVGVHNPPIAFYGVGTNYSFSTAVAGSGTITTTGINVLGVATLFTTELAPGYTIITLSGQARKVLTIADNLHLKVNTSFSPDVAGTTFTIFPGLTGGGLNDVVAGRIPVFITDLNGTWEALVEAINKNSTSVTATIDTGAGTVTVRAIEAGLQGNNLFFNIIIPFFSIPPYTLSGTELTGGTDVHAGGSFFYSGQPADGETVTVGTTTYEFDNNSVVAPGNIVVLIGSTAEDTARNLIGKINTDGQTTATINTVRTRIDVVAVVLGTAGNSIVFSSASFNYTPVPSGGFLVGGVASVFANPDAPTCDEVRDFINSVAIGFTASCDIDGHLILTSNTSRFKSCLVIGHGSANGTLGFESDKGKRNNEAETRPAWRIHVGRSPILGQMGIEGALEYEVFEPGEAGAMMMFGSPRVLVTPPGEVGGASMAGEVDVVVSSHEAGALGLAGAVTTVVTPPVSAMKFALPVFLTDSIDDGGATQSFSSLGWNSGWWASETDAKMKVVQNTTVTSWTVQLDAAVGGGDSITFEIMVNGVADATIPITLNAGDTGKRSADGSLLLSVGDTVSIRGTASGATPASIIVNGFVLGCTGNSPVCAVHVYPNADPFNVAFAGSQGAGQNVADFTGSPFEAYLNPFPANQVFAELSAQLSASTSGTLQPRVGGSNSGSAVSIVASDNATGAISATLVRPTGSGDIASTVGDILASSLASTRLRLMAAYALASPYASWCAIPGGLTYGGGALGIFAGGVAESHAFGANFARRGTLISDQEFKCQLRWPNMPGTFQHFLVAVNTQFVNTTYTVTGEVRINGATAISTTTGSVATNTAQVATDDISTASVAADDLVNFGATTSTSDLFNGGSTIVYGIGFLPS